MAKQTNLDIFLGGFAHILEEQWQVDVLLKAGDHSDPDAAISAHKLVLVTTSSCLFFCYLIGKTNTFDRL